MIIRHLEFAEGAEEATGIAVIIDVFRAFSTACYIYGQGAGKILVTGSTEDAFDYKKDHPGTVLAGERNEKKVKGFDLGNSPSSVIRKDLAKATVVLTTSAGTQGLIKARKADTILAAGFVNAPAIAAFIRHEKPDVVSLVAMGYNAVTPADEDRLCANYIHSLLLGKKPEFLPMREQIRSGTGARFFDPENKNSPQEDFDLCLQPGKFPWALEAVTSGSLMLLKKTEINI